MAYDSSRNYAQEIQDLIKKGGDPAEVNKLLNERLEKQQSMDTGYSTYDDTYRQAMDYMAGQGYTAKASANVDYAEIANQILSSQDAEADDMTHRSWSDLGTVLDAREKKLGTGQYDDWVDSTIGGGDMAYNGENSVHQMLKDYAAYTQMEKDYYQMAADILRSQSGGGNGGGYSSGYGYGGVQTSVPAESTDGVVSGTPVTTVMTKPGVSVPYYSEEDWAKKQNREAARDAVAVTNAATRVPVQGENSSYVQANTNKAFEAATQALMANGDPELEDREAAAALAKAQQGYEADGVLDILIPGVNPTNTAVVGAEYITVPSNQGNGNTEENTEGGNSQGGGSSVSMPVYTAPQAGGGNAASQLTDAEIDALLRDLGIVKTPVFSFAGTEFDSATLGSERGDTAVQAAAGILSGGGNDQPAKDDYTPTPMTQEQTNAGYQAALEAARAVGDYGSVNQIANAWNQYRGQNGQDEPQQYRVYSNQAGDQSMMVTPNQMENFVDKGLIEVQTKPDGSYMYILRDRFTR